uniref:Testis specific protein Y-linked n=1 Tax=Astyanax mexicanus TaxID=7994 RepID=W5JXX9_ASTMX
MSAALDSSTPLSECNKRSSSPRRESELDCPPPKRSKADKEDDEGAVRVAGSSTDEKKAADETSAVGDSSGQAEHKEDSSKTAGKPDSAAKSGCEEPSSAPREKEPSDSAAFAAAEALASLTGGGGGTSGGGGGNQGRGSSSIDDRDKEVMLPCSSRQAALDDKERSSRPSCSSSTSNFTANFSSTTTSSSSTSKDRVRVRGRSAEAAVPDSSSSVLGGAERRDPRKGSNQNQKREKNREDEEDDEDEEEEEEDDSLAGSSSSTASSSVASDNEEGECAIVAVRMAPEVRQSVSLLAQVQMRLDALEKKGARLHQRLELKLSRQRRPHLDQRGAITQTIPGFWVTALLNHPHLSAHIDENDEDALSYMTNLEIETFKNNKLGYRICFHFRRNPFFQNKVIVKELHLGMGGSPVSFSNPILWHRGQNLIGNGEPRRTAQGVYQSFFHWFSDHSSPGRDEIAQILKDDLYRNPLRYYLTPLWEPRQNGPDDSDQEAGESSFEEREEEDLDVEEVGDSRDSGGCEARPQGEEEEEEEDQIDVNEDEEEEEEAAEQS